MTPTFLFAALVWGSIGVGYFVYGKKQQKGMPLVSGIALMVFPYFFSSPLLIVLIGIALMALPFFIKF